MKVLFLDIDGVLNSDDYIAAVTWAGEKSRDKYGMVFDPRCELWLKEIIQRTSAKIVISSTWRASGLSVMKSLWKDRNLAGEVIDVTPFSEQRIRGKEIQMWLNEHKVDQYCIVDDDYDMLPYQIDNFVKTDHMFGLTCYDSNRIINILNN